MADVAPGVNTSEHAIAQKVDMWSNLVIVIGLVIDTLPVLLENVRVAFPQAVWVGTALTVVALVTKVWNAIGYGRNRSIVKASAAAQPEPSQRGFGRLGLLAALAVVAAFAVFAPRARAEEPKFGGCLSGGRTCFGPSVSVNVLALSLRSGDLTSTFDPGIGYGATFFSDRWYRVGFSATVAFPQFDGKKRVQPAGIVSFAEYARLGLACPLWVNGGFGQNAQLLLGFGADLGSAR